ncbi:pPIWI-associating nuclease domain-containing protein [Pedobacter duraquae]|uniref:Uncharacterized protein n=1 Tax=Pedobacter duraquae TaxID=425511 RepID=A0A4R6IJZ8_9SPHI|nr:hypothetical protein [Pedobacter duraquae]TDO22370.1 hypothetical protein CLV32_1339 [Pedobacter duraquae]
MDKSEKIYKLLSSKFEKDLYEAAIASLNENNNKLRYNNFAYSIRELSRHFLYNLSPEANIFLCTWFSVETEDGKPTRAQRIKYAIQGGISDGILSTFGLNVDELKGSIRSIKSSIDSLNKFTHINPEVFDLSDEDVESLSHGVFSNFESFVELITECRSQLANLLESSIHNQMIDAILKNYFENIDMIAPHHSIDYSEISDYFVSEISHEHIIVNVSGELYVTLEYGSKQERREGDGLDMSESFPFETHIRYEISEDFPNSTYQVDDFGVDTLSWYGDEEELGDD